MTHSIATMADVLRNDPGSYGLLSGVGMHMTKHVYGLYSTEPGVVGPPDREGVQANLDAAGKRTIRDVHDGVGTVAAYSVVHGRDGGPEWGVVVCDLPEGDRAYGKVLDGEMLESIERDELVGRKVTLTPTEAETAAGKQTVNVATL
jgi:acetyl-CoA C-acetyltransferase